MDSTPTIRNSIDYYYSEEELWRRIIQHVEFSNDDQIANQFIFDIISHCKRSITSSESFDEQYYSSPLRFLLMKLSTNDPPNKEQIKKYSHYKYQLEKFISNDGAFAILSQRDIQINQLKQQLTEQKLNHENQINQLNAIIDQLNKQIEGLQKATDDHKQPISISVSNMIQKEDEELISELDEITDKSIQTDDDLEVAVVHCSDVKSLTNNINENTEIITQHPNDDINSTAIISKLALLKNKLDPKTCPAEFHSPNQIKPLNSTSRLVLPSSVSYSQLKSVARSKSSSKFSSSKLLFGFKLSTADLKLTSNEAAMKFPSFVCYFSWYKSKQTPNCMNVLDNPVYTSVWTNRDLFKCKIPKCNKLICFYTLNPEKHLNSPTLQKILVQFGQQESLSQLQFAKPILVQLTAEHFNLKRYMTVIEINSLIEINRFQCKFSCVSAIIEFQLMQYSEEFITIVQMSASKRELSTQFSSPLQQLSDSKFNHSLKTPLSHLKNLPRLKLHLTPLSLGGKAQRVQLQQINDESPNSKNCATDELHEVNRTERADENNENLNHDEFGNLETQLSKIENNSQVDTNDKENFVQ